MGLKDKWNEGVERTRQQAAEQAAASEISKRDQLQGPAKKAWDEGQAAYVMTLRFEWTKVRDEDTATAVSAILDIGWKLQSTAMTFVERTGMNNITCMFTFVR